MKTYEKQQFKDFLNSDSKKITIQYKGKKMNVACDWKRLRNPITMQLRGILNELAKKLPPCALKNNLYRAMGVKIGKDVALAPNVTLDPLYPELITIEDGVVIGWGSNIFAHEFLADKVILGRTTIKEEANIGGFVVVRPGTTIGKKAIVSINSFVNKDVGEKEAVGGIPIRPIKIKSLPKSDH